LALWNGTQWVSEPTHPPRPRRRHRLWGAAAEASLITLLLFGLIASTALAAKPSAAGGGGKPGSGSSLALVMVDPADTVANHGDVVTFDVSTSASNPYVNVRCYQGGAFVYDAWAGFYSGAWFGQEFTLASTYWESGEADCIARLVYWAKNGDERVLSQLAFHVAP